MTPKQLQNAMIKRNNKSAYTKPEQAFVEFCKENAFYYHQNLKEKFFHNCEWFDFQMDFVRLNEYAQIDLDIEIDGKGHKEKWDHWKDEIKAANGIKVIHIGAELTKKHWWFYLNLKLKEALASSDMVVYIPE